MSKKLSSAERKATARALFQGTKDLKTMATKLFHVFDEQGKGFLTKEELTAGLLELDPDIQEDIDFDEVFTKEKFTADDFWVGFRSVLRRRGSIGGRSRRSSVVYPSDVGLTPQPLAVAPARAEDEDEDYTHDVVANEPEQPAGTLTFQIAPKALKVPGKKKKRVGGVAFQSHTTVKVHTPPPEPSTDVDPPSEQKAPTEPVKRRSRLLALPPKKKKKKKPFGTGTWDVNRTLKAKELFATLKDGTSADLSGQLFSVLDVEGTGVLTKDNLRDAMIEMDPDNFTEEKLDFVFDRLDEDGNGEIDIDEFRDGFGLFLAGGESAPEGESGISPDILEAFRFADTDKDGIISVDELWNAMGKIIGRQPFAEEQTAMSELIAVEEIVTIDVNAFDTLVHHWAKNAKSILDDHLQNVGSGVKESTMNKEELVQLVLELREKLEQTQTTNLKVSSRYSKASHKFDDLTDQIDQLEQELSSARELLTFKELETTELSEQLGQYKNTHQSLRAEISMLDKKCVELKDNADFLDVQLSDERIEKRQLERQLKSVEEELEALQSTKTAASRANRRESMNQTRQLQSHLRQIKSLKQRVKELEDLEKDIPLYEDEIDRLHKQEEEHLRLLESMRETIYVLRHSMTSLSYTDGSDTASSRPPLSLQDETQEESAVPTMDEQLAQETSLEDELSMWESQASLAMQEEESDSDAEIMELDNVTEPDPEMVVHVTDDTELQEAIERRRSQIVASRSAERLGRTNSMQAHFNYVNGEEEDGFAEVEVVRSTNPQLSNTAPGATRLIMAPMEVRKARRKKKKKHGSLCFPAQMTVKVALDDYLSNTPYVPAEICQSKDSVIQKLEAAGVSTVEQLQHHDLEAMFEAPVVAMLRSVHAEPPVAIEKDIDTHMVYNGTLSVAQALDEFVSHNPFADEAAVVEARQLLAPLQEYGITAVSDLRALKPEEWDNVLEGLATMPSEACIAIFEDVRDETDLLPPVTEEQETKAEEVDTETPPTEDMDDEKKTDNSDMKEADAVAKDEKPAGPGDDEAKDVGRSPQHKKRETRARIEAKFDSPTLKVRFGKSKFATMMATRAHGRPKLSEMYQKNLKDEVFALTKQIHRGIKLKKMEADLTQKGKTMSRAEFTKLAKMYEEVQSNVNAIGDDKPDTQIDAQTQMQLMLSEMRKDMLKKQKEYEKKLEEEHAKVTALRKSSRLEERRMKDEQQSLVSEKKQLNEELYKYKREKEKLERMRLELAKQLGEERQKCVVECSVM